ncbi:ABC transporter substrate-binding protein [Streptomyces tendae]|uniref:ABC transporter substrate-binding protein n=1 Tax=Streptomyces tendae TaxID=1932 RepID=UPI0036C5E82C
MNSSGTAARGGRPGPTRRRFLAGLGAGVSGLALAGCARGDSTAAVEGTASFSNDNASWDDGYALASKALQPLTGYALRPLSVPEAVAYKLVAQMTLQTSRAPDIIKWTSGYELKKLARGGQLTDLSGLWGAYADRGWISESQRNAMQYRGAVYGIPMHESYYVVFYSRPVFARLGLRVPRTWDELLHCATVLKRNGTTPFVGTQYGGWPAYEWFQELLSKTDPGFYTALVEGKARYTDEPAVRAMGIWHDFMRKGWMTPPDYDQGKGAAELRDGRVGMFLHATWHTKNLSGADMRPLKDYDAFVLPTVDRSTKKSVITESSALAVPRRATSHEAGMANVGAWLHPDVQRAWTDYLQDGSANPAVRAGNPVVAGLRDNIAKERRARLVRYSEASPPSLIQGNIQDLSAFMTGQMSPAATLRSMADRADEEWKTWRQDEA